MVRHTLFSFAVAFVSVRYAAAQDATRQFEGTLFRGVALGTAPFPASASFDRAAIDAALASPAVLEAMEAPANPAAAPPPRKRFWTAAGEMVLLEALPAIYNRYVTHEPFAYLSWHTVSENFKAGFGYDSDHFSINQSSHPLHGSLYFNAARSNGYSYWESALFTRRAASCGSAHMENTRPSVNDLVNTTLGGMTRGEVVAPAGGDHPRQHGERRRPVLARARRRGARSRRGVQPPRARRADERLPEPGGEVSGRLLDHGRRRLPARERRDRDPDQALVSLSALYGDPFGGDIEKPFDSFWVGNRPELSGARRRSPRIEERGVLKGWELTRPDRVGPPHLRLLAGVRILQQRVAGLRRPDLERRAPLAMRPGAGLSSR